MSFPDSFVIEIPTRVASELLAYLHDAPATAELRAWAEELRHDTDNAKAQIPLFGTHGTVVDDDWMPVQ